MVLFSYHFFKNFYKEQLANSINEELRAYATMIEAGYDEEFVPIFVMEKSRTSRSYDFFDIDLQPIYSSHNVSEEWLKEYQAWVKERYESGGETLQYVDTGIDFHIPHIWAYQPIVKDGQFKGFFFVDQDTGEFEKAKVQLLLLLFSMGLFTLLIESF